MLPRNILMNEEAGTSCVVTLKVYVKSDLRRSYRDAT